MLEFLEDAHGKVLVLRCAHVKRKAVAVQLREHLGDAGIDRIVAPADAVVAGAVVARQRHAILFAAVRAAAP